ncbi:hypothetical protein TEA_026328 [Camellia sinensis var. sinensis]|uniref:Inhibitor I9 domain-containing protein n=1 Tax=Camellia sinensis var. sinensis TaxID=542762 RepID=A0A4S4E9Y9_CAMSN|nr:hypothetical protein TEA_026328 [Camellia sinensis var. sinensis]
MKTSGTFLVFVVFFNLCHTTTLINASEHDDRKAYERHQYLLAGYCGLWPKVRDSPGDSHRQQHEMIAKESKIHSYGRSFNGFVAKLLPHEATRLSEKESVVSVFPNTVRELHTTRSWDFLGMPEKSMREQTFNRASAVSDCIGNKSLTYRIQADTYRESADTDGKFILTGIPVSIQLGPAIFRYEPASTARTGRYLEP